MNNLSPWLRLQLTPGLGRAGLIRLITHYKTPANAINAVAEGWPPMSGIRTGLAKELPAATDSRIDKALEALAQNNGWYKTFLDPDYPQALRQIPDPPALFYGCGKLPEGPYCAVVGARHPTSVGRVFTEHLTEELAASGLVIVSGLARGIDTAAHRGTLRKQGKTVAILGCGIDIIYPPENRTLFQQIVEQGAILSEYLPGTEPLPGHFPGRNRIISGLSKGTLVVEASRDSGSLITAEFALEQGREVMAVPGGVDRKTSYGPNLLIKQGAHPITEAGEVLQILGIDRRVKNKPHGDDSHLAKLDEPLGSVLSILDLTPRHSDELAGESGLTAMELSAILLQLELQGYAEKLPGGRYIRGRRSQ